MRIIKRNSEADELNVSKIIIAINKSIDRCTEKYIEEIMYHILDFSETHDDTFYKFARKEAYSKYKHTVKKTIEIINYDYAPTSKVQEELSFKKKNPIKKFFSDYPLIAGFFLELILLLLGKALDIGVAAYQTQHSSNIACAINYHAEDYSVSLDFYENACGTVILPDGSTISYACDH